MIIPSQAPIYTAPLPTEEAPVLTEHSPEFAYQIAILIAMSRNPKMHVYEGTVTDAEIAKRRAKNRRARQARKANR